MSWKAHAGRAACIVSSGIWAQPHTPTASQQQLAGGKPYSYRQQQVDLSTHMHACSGMALRYREAPGTHMQGKGAAQRWPLRRPHTQEGAGVNENESGHKAQRQGKSRARPASMCMHHAAHVGRARALQAARRMPYQLCYRKGAGRRLKPAMGGAHNVAHAWAAPKPAVRLMLAGAIWKTVQCSRMPWARQSYNACHCPPSIVTSHNLSPPRCRAGQLPAG